MKALVECELARVADTRVTAHIRSLVIEPTHRASLGAWANLVGALAHCRVRQAGAYWVRPYSDWAARMSSPVIQKSDAIARASALCCVGETWYCSVSGRQSKTAVAPSRSEKGRRRSQREFEMVWWLICVRVYHGSVKRAFGKRAGPTGGLWQ